MHRRRITCLARLLLGIFLAASLVSCRGSSTGQAGSDSTTSSTRAAPDPCSGSSAVDLTSIDIDVDGRTREADIHIPVGADDTEPLPLVLGFHGFGGTTADLEGDTGLFEEGDAKGFVTVLPVALGRPSRWEVRDRESLDLAFVDALLIELEARICIDPSRIYTTGFSQGAAMANVVGCSRPDRFAAIAAVSGVYDPRWRETCVGEPLPVIGFHGVLDPVVPYRGDSDVGGRPIIGAEAWAAQWAQLNQCAGGPEALPPIGDVEPLFWTTCSAAVEFYRVTEAGHSWPGGVHDDPDMGGATRAISANELIWSFFERHAVPA